MNVFPVLREVSVAQDPFWRWQEDVEQMLGGWLGTARPVQRWERRVSPVMELEEGDEVFWVRLDMPGIEAEGITVTVEDQKLVVTGESRTESRPTDGRYVSERAYGRYYREIGLPAGVDVEKIEALLKNGVLTLSVPKAALPKGRTIPIKTA
ncbi:MAG: Hsp20/alpha crystallin family protein [Thermaerobacter sp.]|nr:Hsp20/alpha crystallin family protein [Thermaerobacter sp.]